MSQLIKIIVILGLFFSLNSQLSYANSLHRGEFFVEYCDKEIIGGGEIDPDNFLKTDKSLFCMAYLAGITDFLGLKQVRDLLKKEMKICLPEPPNRVSVRQVGLIVIKFSEDHPEKLNIHRLNFTLSALLEAFPCKP